MSSTVHPAVAELRESPFFVLNGPDGRRLSCQWTAWSAPGAHACGTEFEIVCPETPEAMGCLFGLFDDGAFRMRPAIRSYDSGHSTRHAMAPDLDLDLAWRGSIDDVLEVGHDWDMGPGGLLVIADPEAPAEDPADALPLRLAA